MSGATLVDARIETRSCAVELIHRVDPSPCEFVLRESRHVVALQLQRRQSLSTGRFRVADTAPDFHDIGRLLVVPADLPLHIRAEGGPTSSVRCCFDARALARATGLDELVDPKEAALCLDVKSTRLVDTLTRIGSELRAPGIASRVLIEALGQSLMVELARYMHERQPSPAVRRGGLSRRVHRQIVELIESANRAPSIASLSRLTGLSSRHLSRAFRQTTGWTIHDYIARVRFNRGAELLADTDLPIKDIAFRLGFACSSSFSVAFRRAAGEAPRSYRRRVRPQAPGEPAAAIGRRTEALARAA